MTTMTPSVVLPPVLVGDRVGRRGRTAEGVPLMAPVDESSERPLGKEGETDHVVMAPPLEVGVAVVMAVPFVR